MSVSNLFHKVKTDLFSITIALLLVAGLFAPLQSVGAASLCVAPGGAGGCYASIQAAINAANPGDTINVAAGTYSENININKRLQIIGAGSSTVITQNAAGAGDSRVGVVQLSASGTAAAPILLQNLRIQPVGLAGISVGLHNQSTGTTVSYLNIDHVQVVGTNISPSTEQERGLYVDRTSTLRYLNVTNSAFDNLTYGWYLHKDVSADTSNVRYVTVTDTTFNHNNHKGIYAEKLSDATFIRCTADQNGYDSSILPSYFQPWSAGIDINLKAGTYSNLYFGNCTVTNNAIDQASEGAGLTVKARDDAPAYSGFPATLSNVSIIGGLYSGNERGIRIGEPGKNNQSPTNVVIHYASIIDNFPQYSGQGSETGDVINQLRPGTWVDATMNWWGDALGPYAVRGSNNVPPCNNDPSDDTNPDGVGAGVSDYVDFCPWLLAPAAFPVVTDTVPADGASLAVGPTQLTVEFNENVKSDASAGAANYAGNYLLVEENGNGFQTRDCAQGYNAGDVIYPINAVSYTDNAGAGPFISTLNINGGAALPEGSYRLFVCGTTSIENSINLKLNNGQYDTTVDFTVQQQTTPATTSLPATGFPHGRATSLPEQSPAKAYTDTAITLEIPQLGLSMPIVGVPQSGDSWDVTWLGDSAGWLNGSAFPTWAGNTVLTGHVWDAWDQPGPFAALKTLRYGDQFTIVAYGQTYTYEVRENKLLWARTGYRQVFQHEEYDWVTLLTCEHYNPFNGDYFFRRAVRAVLVSVK